MSKGEKRDLVQETIDKAKDVEELLKRPKIPDDLLLNISVDKPCLKEIYLTEMEEKHAFDELNGR